MKSLLAKHTLALVLSLSVVLWPVVAAASDGADMDEATDFAVATYNINFGNRDLAGIVATIAASDADLVALQEVTPEAEEYLREHLAEAYPQMAFWPGEKATGFGFLARATVELGEPRYLAPVHGWFGTYLVEATLEGVRVAVANVHLQPTLPKRGDSAFDMMKRFLELEQVRAREMEDIVASLPAGDDVVRIVAGDLNTLTGMTTVNGLRESGFADTFAALHEQPDAHPTWHWTIGERRWTFRLDYIFAEAARATPLASQVIADEDASDHFLVVTRFAASQDAAASAQ